MPISLFFLAFADLGCPLVCILFLVCVLILATYICLHIIRLYYLLFCLSPFLSLLKCPSTFVRNCVYSIFSSFCCLLLLVFRFLLVLIQPK